MPRRMRAGARNIQAAIVSLSRSCRWREREELSVILGYWGNVGGMAGTGGTPGLRVRDGVGAGVEPAHTHLRTNETGFVTF